MTIARHPELVERADALDRLRALLDEVSVGRGGVAVIQGPPGIGKTRLGEEAAAHAGDFRVLRAAGGELEQDFAFGVARQLFEPVIADAEHRDALLDGAAALAGPPLGMRGSAAELSGEDARFGAIHGLHWLTAGLAAEAPLLLWVDDLQWADSPSRRFLAYLARRLTALPVVLLVAQRPALPGEERAEAAAMAADAMVLEPGPLSTEGVEALVTARFGAPADPGFAAECRRLTDGNAFLLQALLADLDAPDAALARAHGGRVARSVELRLGRLPPAARDLARAVAVLGDGYGPQAAGALAGLSAGDARSAADVLIAADLLAPDPSLRFRHPLVRAAVAGGLSPVSRAETHGRAARLLGEQGAPAAVLAAHLLAGPAEADPWALDVLRAAAEDAMRQGAPEHAARLLVRALDEGPPAPVRREVVLDLAQAEHDAGVPGAAERLHAALALTEDALERARVGLQLATVLNARQQWAEAADAAREALAAAVRRDRELELTLRAVLADSVRMDGTLEGDEAAELVRVAAGLDGATRAERLVLATAASITPADTAAAHAAAAELLDRSATLDPGGAARPETGIVSNFIRAGRLERAAEVISRVMEQARSRGLVQRHGLMLFMRGWVAFERGELAAAEEDLREALDLAVDTGMTPVSTAPLLAATLAEQGELGAADAVLTRYGAADTLPEHQSMNPALHFRARVRLAQGRDDDALADALEVGQRYERLGLRRAVPPWRSLAAVLLARHGEAERARALAAEELELARRWGTPLALAGALRGLGLVEGDVRALAAAVAALDETPWRLELARAAIDLGAALRRGGRRAESRAPLRRGMDLAQRCGAVPLAERARTELVASGARPRRLALSGAGSLTASERRVAELAAAGRTNRGIAQDLFVTTSTVETHLRQAFRKLDVTSRTQLARALRNSSG